MVSVSQAVSGVVSIKMLLLSSLTEHGAYQAVTKAGAVGCECHPHVLLSVSLLIATNRTCQLFM